MTEDRRIEPPAAIEWALNFKPTSNDRQIRSSEIAPPPELVQQWYDAIDNSSTAWKQELATQAARWGADQELEACCEWLDTYVPRYCEWSANFRYDRRPEPPSLKAQALLQLDTLNADLGMHGMGCDLSQIRRALESLPD